MHARHPRILALVLVHVLLALPTLCLGGWLEHPCDCESAPIPCSHEESCPDDPCASVPAPQEKESADTWLATSPLQPCVLGTALFDVRESEPTPPIDPSVDRSLRAGERPLRN